MEAVAGAGKTTTLLMGLGLTAGNAAMAAYNKAIATEISERLKGQNLGARVKVGTMHSFGLAALKSAYPKTQINGDKLKMIAEKAVDKRFYRAFAANAASMAKQTGIGIFTPITDYSAWLDMIDHHSLADNLPEYARLEDAIEAAQEVLRVSNLNVSKVIDFDDMVYIPVLENLKVRQYDWVFLDEAQDTNFVRRELVKKMLSSKGRLVAVGDSHQAIYGFTGADCESMENIRKEFNAIRLPLTVSYRCPKTVVEKANEWVSHIQAADNAPDGTVDTAELETLIKEQAFSPKDAVICRKTKPLVELAFKLIQAGIPCKVEGRAIGRGLVSLARKWKVATVGELDAKLDKWATREMEKAMLKGNSARCNFVEDQAETLRVMMQHCEDSDSIETLCSKILSFFGDIDNATQQILTLSTIHRAKGKEWNRVFALDVDKHSPSRWAQKPWELAQETNLCYVQVTRAKSHLTFVCS
jgi:superfamily I DNA/RNA helicase